MGYSTNFAGQFTCTPPLTAVQVSELMSFHDDDHRDQYGTWSAYCQWVPTGDGKSIEWDGGEKFYDYAEWLERLIEKFFKPWGVTLGGSVDWIGEDKMDQGVIYIKDNVVQAVPSIITKPDPKWKIEKPEPKW